MAEILCTIVTSFGAVLIAIIGKKQLDVSHRMERRAELRKRESLLSLEYMDANTQLTTAIANAVLGGHNNGNVEQARESVGEVSEKYREFMRETTAYEVGK